MSEPSELLLQHLPAIEQIIEAICRRKGMDTDATEEFAAEVKLRLVEDDYAIVRAFRHRSSFPVYIGAVVRRLLLDHRNREWGKWRASAEAQRMGPLGIDLERLLHRDGRSIDDAFVALAPLYPAVTIGDLQQLALRLPPRVRRRKVDLEEATEIPAPEGGTDPIRNDTARRLSSIVTTFIDALPDEDQLILQLRFQANMSVADIARALRIEQPALYRRLYRRFAELRSELERAGVASKDVEELIGADPNLLDFRLKTRSGRPSQEEESAVAARQEEMS